MTRKAQDDLCCTQEDKVNYTVEGLNHNSRGKICKRKV